MSFRLHRRTIIAGVGAAGLTATLCSHRSNGVSIPPSARADESVRDFRQRPLEGGRVILDRSRYPRAFKEAPRLKELVEQRQLPPVAERIGLDPIVIEPLHEIGAYGGVIRRGFIGPGDGQTATRFAAGPDALLFWDHEWKNLRPNIARDFEVSRDGRVTTIFLRRGMRWSDGHAFTADDILFWFDKMYNDRRVISQRAPSLRLADQDLKVRKLDDHTLEYISPEPYYMLPEMLAGFTDVGGPSVGYRTGFGGFGPAHYLSRFHADFVEEATLLRQARENGFANWSLHLRNRFDWTLNKDLPVISPWQTASPVNQWQFTLTRNPYSVWVDTDGNQLPYVDAIVHTYCSDGDTINFKASMGAFDFQERHLQIGKLPLLLHNRRRSNYEVMLNPAEGADLTLRFNLTCHDDPEIAALLADKRFRQALSIATDRRQINDTFMHGTGLETAAVPSPNNKYYPGEEWARRWAVLDVEQANRLLDDIGLIARDNEGFRLRKDGTDRVRLISSVNSLSFDYPGVSEMLRAQWRSIGIDVDTKIEEPNLSLQRAMNGTTQITLQYTITEDPFTFPDFLFPYSRSVSGAIIGIDYARWFQTSGAEGARPPEEIIEIMELWKRGRVAPVEQRIEIGKQIIRRHVEEVLSMGIVSSGLAFYGIQVANKNLGNVPRRTVNSTCMRSPAAALPMTFYYRNRQDA